MQQQPEGQPRPALRAGPDRNRGIRCPNEEGSRSATPSHGPDVSGCLDIAIVRPARSRYPIPRSHYDHDCDRCPERPTGDHVREPVHRQYQTTETDQTRSDKAGKKPQELPSSADRDGQGQNEGPGEKACSGVGGVARWKGRRCDRHGVERHGWAIPAEEGLCTSRSERRHQQRYKRSECECPLPTPPPKEECKEQRENRQADKAPQGAESLGNEHPGVGPHPDEPGQDRLIVGDEPTTVEQVICNEDEHRKTEGEERRSDRESAACRRHVCSEGGSLVSTLFGNHSLWFWLHNPRAVSLRWQRTANHSPIRR